MPARYRRAIWTAVWTGVWVFLLPGLSLLAGSEAAMYALVVAGFLLYDQVYKGWRGRLAGRPLLLPILLTFASVVGAILIWHGLIVGWLTAVCRRWAIDLLIDHSGDVAYFPLCYEGAPDVSTQFWLAVTAVITPLILVGLFYAFFGVVALVGKVRRRGKVG